MALITFELNAEDERIIREYVSNNKLDLSEFIRMTILEKIEEDLELDGVRIVAALETARREKQYTHQETWDILESE